MANNSVVPVKQIDFLFLKQIATQLWIAMAMVSATTVTAQLSACSDSLFSSFPLSNVIALCSVALNEILSVPLTSFHYLY